MNIGLNTAEIKARLSELVSRVASDRDRLIILRRGKPMAALISMKDLHRLEALDAAEVTGQGQTAHPVMQAFGGWADREDLDDLVTEIYAARQATGGREVEF